MLPDRVSNPGPLTYESGTLPIALRGPALTYETEFVLFLAVLEILSCPWTETAHMRHYMKRQLFTNVPYARYRKTPNDVRC